MWLLGGAPGNLTVNIFDSGQKRTKPTGVERDHYWPWYVSWSYWLPSSLPPDPIIGFKFQWRPEGSTRWNTATVYDSRSDHVYWMITPVGDRHLLTWSVSGDHDFVHQLTATRRSSTISASGKQVEFRVAALFPDPNTATYDYSSTNISDYDSSSHHSRKKRPNYDLRGEQSRALTAGSASEHVSAAVTRCEAGKSYSPSLLRCASPPNAPQLTASAGDGSITVTWAPPAATGGAPVGEYEVHWRRSGTGDLWESVVVAAGQGIRHSIGFGLTESLLTYPHTINGLKNAVPYDVRIAAVNTTGSSPWASASLVPCPQGLTYVAERGSCLSVDPPGAPSQVWTLSGSATGEVGLLWQPPANNGGAAITKYIIKWRLADSPRSGWNSKEVTNATPSNLEGIPPFPLSWNTVLTGLTNDKQYEFKISAVNPEGEGHAAHAAGTPCLIANSNKAHHCDLPGEPTALHAASQPGALEVTWASPLRIRNGEALIDDGGASITHFIVTWKETTSSSVPSTLIVHYNAKRQGIPPVLTLEWVATLSSLKNNVEYTITISARNAAGDGAASSITGMPCPEGQHHLNDSINDYEGCQPKKCPEGFQRVKGGRCIPMCGVGEEYQASQGGCRPTDETCQSDEDLRLARDASGYCKFEKTMTPAANDITYTPLECDEEGEFSAMANADTYINTDLDDKDLTDDKTPMCPPIGLFLALGERRRAHIEHPDDDNPTDHIHPDYYYPEWANEDDLKDSHKKVVVRGSGDCTGISPAIKVYGQPGRSGDFLRDLVEALPWSFSVKKFVELVAEERRDELTGSSWRLRSGVAAACQAHDYCYDLIRSGLHQTVTEGRANGCDEVLRELWISYCHKLTDVDWLGLGIAILTFSWIRGIQSFPNWNCSTFVAEVANFIMRGATTSPEAGVVLLRHSGTGKCLTVPAGSTADVRVVQERCGYDSSHRPNDQRQWFHVLQAEPLPNFKSSLGSFYFIPANIITGDQDSWKLKLDSNDDEVKGKKCLYVGGALNREVRRGDCMVGGARAKSRVFYLFPIGLDGYGIRESWGRPSGVGCWRPVVGASSEATAADGVLIENTDAACGNDSARWRFEPVDPRVKLGN